VHDRAAGQWGISNVVPGLHIQVLDCLKPGEDEIILPKTSADVFSSTNIDYLLRCLGVKYLLLAGCVTDQCVESAVRHACDLGYLVTLVTGIHHSSIWST
jgi:ureidoacrylate peracid hydrolase